MQGGARVETPAMPGMRRQRRRRQAGFTLVELIVVVAIIALLIAVSANAADPVPAATPPSASGEEAEATGAVDKSRRGRFAGACGTFARRF